MGYYPNVLWWFFEFVSQLIECITVNYWAHLGHLCLASSFHDENLQLQRSFCPQTIIPKCSGFMAELVYVPCFTNGSFFFSLFFPALHLSSIQLGMSSIWALWRLHWGPHCWVSLSCQQVKGGCYSSQGISGLHCSRREAPRAAPEL
jgi:hypothetical protein